MSNSKTKYKKSIDDSERFNINDYEIIDISSLLVLIDDLIQKEPPEKKQKSKLPRKLYKLIDIYDPLFELNNLIGLDTLKQQLLEQLLYFIQDLSENIMLHTVIEGPPGTGKTTVAKLMSEIYSGIGILKKNKFNIVKREDLIGQYLGETTIKTMETLDRCKNGIMLIDEAYSLGSPGNQDSYAKEAIDCINQYLTENANNMICIIAGYKNELEKYFFSQNPGLSRRFPWTFSIDKFTRNELTQIFIKKIEESEYYLLEENVNYDFIHSLIKTDYFTGNAGDIDNIISRIKIINSRINFGKENNYTINSKCVEEGFSKYYETKKNKIDKIPFLMYS